MKYCLKYRHKSKFVDEVDELMIDYYRKDGNILYFLEKHKHQRLIFNVTYIEDFLNDTDSVAFFAEIKKSYPDINIALKFNIPHILDDQIHLLIQQLQEKNIPYFFGLKVTDWDILHLLISQKVSDVYITEAMGFEIADAATILHKHGIKVRVFPNVAQSSNAALPAQIKFFIRPDDTKIYEPYVDVFEIFGQDDRLDAYYKVYAIQRKWLGKLSDLILFSSYDKGKMQIDNRHIDAGFALKRTVCGKKCLKGSSCKSCFKFLDLATERYNLLNSVDYTR